ncbi:MAG: hypothetical protein NTV52_21565 [Acidobacteria bacterium]|nr:hypothetical protein [Acidobacteriota bacterium]
MQVKEAIEIAAKESGNQTKNHGDSPLIDEDYLKDLHSDLIDALLKARDVCQTRVRSLRLMEDMQEGSR